MEKIWIIMDKHIDEHLDSMIVYYIIQNEETLERKVFSSVRNEDLLFLVGDKVITTRNLYDQDIISDIERIK